jgi:prevent-host-death family protein
MADFSPTSNHVWTVAEAKARLSELLRRAREHGPQRIGTRVQYVVIAAEEWDAISPSRPPIGRWLVENMPRHTILEPPDRRDPPRPIPFASKGVISEDVK